MVALERNFNTKLKSDLVISSLASFFSLGYNTHTKKKGGYEK